VIVDGGLGAELQQRGFRPTTALWSGEAVLSAPELLVATHRDFLAAGAQVIEAATYQLAHSTLRALGYTGSAIDEIFARAVGLARAAVAGHRAATGATRAYVVAASLGPFGATLGDGSEYSGLQHLERDELYAFHAERVRSIAQAQPDAIVFETIPSLHEALVIAEVARDAGLASVWMSFSCPDGAHTYAGDGIGEAAAQLDRFDCIEVIGVNCTAPASTAPLLREIKRATSKALYACPNLGQHWESATQGLAGGESEAAFLGCVPDWLELGVTHIGGCCGVGPRTLGALAALAS